MRTAFSRFPADHVVSQTTGPGRSATGNVPGKWLGSTVLFFFPPLEVVVRLRNHQAWYVRPLSKAELFAPEAVSLAPLSLA